MILLKVKDYKFEGVSGVLQVLSPKMSASCDTSIELTETVLWMINQKFISATNSTLTEILDKLNNLENKVEILGSEVKISKMETAGMRAAMFKRDAEGFFGPFSQPQNGISFKGSTCKAISARVPTGNMLIAQIKNYMDVDLTGYQLYLPFGFVFAPAPNKISAKTTEIAIFFANQKKNIAAEPEMSYCIGGTDISLHLYFVRGGTVQTFAAALLPRNAPAGSIISLDCTDYKHSGSVGSHDCIKNVGENKKRNLTVYEGNIFVRVTFETESYPRPGILTCEVFKLTF
ncbi:unnamed protein product [Allacma fusca]|uniref:Uncharacterized protein n=1 Tax=Allacma fusca TaxID=39272 RepID=A0A8J2PPW8_9HEXA|nr:unnamed protein product [Allacma fusca]